MTAQQGAQEQGKKVNKMCFASPAPPWDAPASAVQPHLWGRGRRLVLGGPRGMGLCSGDGCWRPPSLLDTGVGCFPMADCQGKVKARLNPAYPVPSCISENTRRALKQGLDLHRVHGVLKQPRKTRRAGGGWPRRAAGLPLADGPTRLPKARPEPCRKRGVTRQRSPAPGLVAKPTPMEPTSLRDRNTPSLGWKDEFWGRTGPFTVTQRWTGFNVVSEVSALPKTSRIRSPGDTSHCHKSFGQRLSPSPSGEDLGTTPSSGSIPCEEGTEPGSRGGSPRSWMESGCRCCGFSLRPPPGTERAKAAAVRPGPCGNGTGAAGVKRKTVFCCTNSFLDQNGVFLSAERCAQTHVVMWHNLFLSSCKTPGLRRAESSRHNCLRGSSASHVAQPPTCPSRAELAFVLSKLFC